MSHVYIPTEAPLENEYQEYAWGVESPTAKFQLIKINRQRVRDFDVKIEMKYCGICHTDVHSAHNDLHNGLYPMVPGHELVGVVVEIGSKVTQFKIGDNAGVGVLVDSCLNCSNCLKGDEQYCQNFFTFTYNSLKNKDGHLGGNMNTQTHGGYTKSFVSQEKFVIKLPEYMDLAKAAPLLCAGITLYDPLKFYGATTKKSMNIGIVGIGGLGTMGIKLAKALGHTVYAFSLSKSKEGLAREKGADFFVDCTDQESMKKHQNTCDLILNTASANHQVELYLQFLRVNGTICQLGLVTQPHTLNQLPLLFKRISVSGSLIGGIKNTQECIDFCYKHSVYPDIEIVTADKIDQVYEELTVSNKDGIRYVIDIVKSLPQ